MNSKRYPRSYFVSPQRLAFTLIIPYLTLSAVVQCINAGAVNEELHIILRRGGEVMDEQIQVIGPGSMVGLQINAPAADQLSLRIHRPGIGGQTQEESGAACWLVTYKETADGMRIALDVPIVPAS